MNYAIIPLLSVTLTLSVACAQNFTGEPAQADKQARELVVAAYGGSRLLDMESVVIESDRRLSYPNTDYSPNFNEYIEDRNRFHIDFVNLKASSERYVTQNGNTFHDQTITSDTGLAQINYPLNRVSYKKDYRFFDEFGGVFRLSDTLLAYLIGKYPERMRSIGNTRYRDRELKKLELAMPETNQLLTVLVDAETGYIKRVERALGEQTIRYLFRNHSSSDGVLFARESQVFLGDRLFDFEIERQLSVNAVQARDFEVSDALDLHEQEMSDETKVIEIAEGFFHVGEGISYTSFLVTENGLIAWGLNDGFENRYSALAELRPKLGPLEAAIVSHHHELRRSGIDAALKTGAYVYVPSYILEKMPRDLDSYPPSSIKAMNNGDSIGPIDVYEIETAHAQSMYVGYVKHEKILLEEDHYRPVYDGAPRHLFGASVSLVRKIEALGLDVEFMLSGHGSKKEAWQDLLKLATDDRNSVCYPGRTICAD
ncbi:MAG: hypothetical protein AAF385_10915 [Pseudomonadota bacterium]